MIIINVFVPSVHKCLSVHPCYMIAMYTVHQRILNSFCDCYATGAPQVRVHFYTGQSESTLVAKTLRLVFLQAMLK